MGIFSILRANRLYLDDLGRALYGYADWVAAARPLAEFLSWLFYLGPTTVDASPLTQILAAFLLALASFMLIETVRARPSWGVVLCTVPVGLSPYGLENLSYRFDAPWMALAVVLALIPGCLYRSGQKVFFLVAACCLFASAALYQPALGAYLVVGAYAVLTDLASRMRMRLVAIRALRFILPFILGVGLYAAQASFWIQESQYDDYVLLHVILPELEALPRVLLENIRHYFSLLIRDWSGNGIGLVLGLMIMTFTLTMLLRHARNLRFGGSVFWWGLRFVLLLALIPCFLLCPFGIQFALQNPVWTPRTFQGFGVAAALMLLFLYGAAKRNSLRQVFRVAQLLLLLQLFIFAQVYGNLLDAQAQWELSRIGLLASDLNRFIRETGSSRVNFVGSMGLSPLVRTPARKYPLLERLVTVPLTRDWRWGYEQLNTFGVKVEPEEIAKSLEQSSVTPFLETPAYRIEVTPDGVGLITFLPPPLPKPVPRKPYSAR